MLLTMIIDNVHDIMKIMCCSAHYILVCPLVLVGSMH